MNQQMAHSRVPRDIRKMLLTGEEVLMAVKQSRWKALFTPDTIVVTNLRVIRYSPSGFLGLHKDIEDYRYEDMANFNISKGIMFATVTISHRFMSESLVLNSLPNSRISDISKVVEEHIGRARGNTTSEPIPPTLPQDALEVLKLRFAQGEITQEQYEEMKRAIE